MDFSRYQNIANLSNQLGKVKQTVFNKKKYAQAEETWNKFTPEELDIINQEAAGAVRVMNCFVSPNYVFVLELAVFYVIPVKDMVWMYTSIVTQTMYFIPYSKTHRLFLLDRNGNYYTLGEKNTGGFSKKKPCDDAMKQVCNVVAPQRRGLIVGWTQQVAEGVKNNFAAVVQSVDSNSVV